MVNSPWGPFPWWMIYLPATVLGLCLGSFANVLIYRLPREESVVHPPSRCPKCGRPIRPWENIPLVSWIVLRGRCAGCHERISVLYPLVEGISGILALSSVVIFGVSYAAFAYVMLLIALLALIIIDIQHWLLPFSITLPIAIIGFTGSLIFNMRPVADSLLGMAVGFCVFIVLLLGGKLVFRREAMGGGDVAFGVMAGAFLGWKLTLLMVFLAAFFGTLISLPLLLLGKSISGRMIPFGPFLAVALVVCLLVGDHIINWYMGLLGG